MHGVLFGVLFGVLHGMVLHALHVHVHVHVHCMPSVHCMCTPCACARLPELRFADARHIDKVEGQDGGDHRDPHLARGRVRVRRQNARMAVAIEMHT